jgi:hypothetical protein
MNPPYGVAMKEMMTSLALVLALMPTGSLLAHHSIVNFDTTAAVRVKGTIVRFHEINPHSFIYLDAPGPDGTTRRWAVEGPAIFQLKRMGIATDFLRPGATIEVCGYLHKENVIWQIASTEPRAQSLGGRLLNAETMVTPDGKELSWGDYGAHKCFAPGHRDQHSR